MEKEFNLSEKITKGIIRWLPHKLSIWWLELTGGLKK